MHYNYSLDLCFDLLVTYNLFLFKVTEADDEDYDSVDSSEASDPKAGVCGHQITRSSDEAIRGNMTDDSGIDSITVSPTREAGGMMETLLNMAMTGEKLLY